MEYKEFFEKYWRVKDANGNMVPMQLSEIELEIFQVAGELKVDAFILHRGRNTGIIINPIVRDEIERRQNLLTEQ